MRGVVHAAVAVAIIATVAIDWRFWPVAAWCALGGMLLDRVLSPRS